MKHFSITIFSGLVFLAAAFFAGALPGVSESSGGVSQKTEVLGRFRETSPEKTVKQGVSRDGLFSVMRVLDAPNVSPRVKSYNHARTLRAFVAPNHDDVLMLYVESVVPHEYYSLLGDFAVMTEHISLLWIGETTLTFYGMSPKGELMRYAADPHLLTLSRAPIDPTSPLSREDIPSSFPLP